MGYLSNIGTNVSVDFYEGIRLGKVTLSPSNHEYITKVSMPFINLCKNKASFFLILYVLSHDLLFIYKFGIDPIGKRKQPR